MVTTRLSAMAGKVLAELRKCGVTHVVWLPSSENNAMYQAMLREPQITIVPVCREGECTAVAFGLWLGGKNPVVMHQSTGLYEAGDSMRGLALDLELPFLMLIGARGWPPPGGPPPTDSAATYLEAILDAWGVKHYLLMDESQAGMVSLAYREALEKSRPVAVLIAGEE